jgi:exodeoxyribonuclease VII small subunit
MAKKTPTNPRTFEEAMAELERILLEIEAGEVGLEQSLLRYERGVFLLRHCRSVLEQAEKKIELLSKGEGGELLSQPLDETADPLADDASDGSA